MAEKIANLKGEGGFLVIDDTTEHTGPFEALKALGGDVVFSAVSGAFDGSLADKTLSNGDILHGNFRKVTLTSGVCVGYYKVD